MTPTEQFAQLVALKGSRRMVGSTSLKTAGKMFAFLNKERLIVKLPAARVAQGRG